MSKAAVWVGACFWLISLLAIVSGAACVRQQACGWEAMATAYLLGAGMLFPAWLAARLVNQVARSGKSKD